MRGGAHQTKPGRHQHRNAPHTHRTSWTLGAGCIAVGAKAFAGIADASRLIALRLSAAAKATAAVLKIITYLLCFVRSLPPLLMSLAHC